MTLHDSITLMIVPIGTSGYKEIQHIKYTSEYILKLQIHQHTSLSVDETPNYFVSILLDKATIFSMSMKFPSASLSVRHFIVAIFYGHLQNSFYYLPLEN